MSQVKNESELLRSGDVSAFSRWDLPSFDAEPHHIPLERAAEAAAKPEAEAEAAADPQELDVEAVKPFTVEELEQIREEAYNEGFATGEKDGFHSGQLKAQQEAKTVLAKRTAELDALMAQLMAPLKQQDEQIKDMLLMLLEQMLRAVLQREMQVDRAQVVSVLRSALKALPVGAENIRIYLNPLDFESIKALRERHDESWRLLEDDQLMPGGCRIETEHSQVDATLETRLQQLIAQLYEQRREQRAHPPAADLPISERGADPQ